ncbi:MAG: hypothetical protein ACP5O8_00670 [Candidatus Aenigmatarchaeota archaeon]
MVLAKKKGYRVERKIRKLFEKHGWRVVRAGASLGEADLICIKNKKCILLQVKSTKNNVFYYYGYSSKSLEGFPFYLVVDFGYGKIKIIKPKQKINLKEGEDIEAFLAKN